MPLTSQTSLTKMADNKNTRMKLKLPFMVKLKLTMFALSRLLCARRDGKINSHLQRLFDLKTSAPATKRINSVTVTTSDVSIDPSRNLWFRLFTPINHPNKLPLIVYFHGGGFYTFAPDSLFFDDLCSQLSARLPAVIVSVNYRLAPEHRYPSQQNDCFETLKFIADSKNSAILPQNADLENCYLAGDSAGGNIAHHVTVTHRSRSRSSQIGTNMKILGVILIQPFFGGEERTESEINLRTAPMFSVKETDWMWRMFLPEGEDRDHFAVNIFKDPEREKEMKGLDFPDVLVIMGGYDPMRDWHMRYVDGMKRCGKRVVVIDLPEAFHGFYAFPQVKEFAAFVAGVREFVYRQSVH